MALFKSKYEELTFYVGGKARSFRHGFYRTDDKKEIEVLEKLADVKKEDEDHAKDDEVKPKQAKKK